jgi:hypothetical protein
MMVAGSKFQFFLTSLCVCVCAVLEMEPRVSHMPDKHSTPQLCPRLSSFSLSQGPVAHAYNPSY